jgi:putative tricarboxylic transport membrane protein
MLVDRIIFVCIIVLAAVYFYATAQIPTLEIGDPLGPKAFPRLLGIGLLITAALLFFEMRKAAKEARPAEAQPHGGGQSHLWIIGGVAIWTAVYYLAFDPAGYIISTSVYLLGLTAYFHRGKWVANILTSVLFAVGSYVLFVKVFGVMLAQGMIKF